MDEQPKGPIVKGKVKWFNIKKGFGFIACDEEDVDDIHVHFTGITLSADADTTFRTLKNNEEVEFVVGKDKNGRKTAVRVTGPSGAPVIGVQRRRFRKKGDDTEKTNSNSAQGDGDNKQTAKKNDGKPKGRRRRRRRPPRDNKKGTGDKQADNSGDKPEKSAAPPKKKATVPEER